jgi:multidrug efflux pump
MNKFNLTEWSLNHKQLVYFFIFLVFAAGLYSYQILGRREDPEFTIKQMLVTVAWPGATAHQVEEQVTDKIEKKLQNLPDLDYLKSYSRPGQALIYVFLKEPLPVEDVRPRWLEVRNMVNDIKDTLPAGVIGPYYNDRFEDVYGSIYVIAGEGFSYEEKRVQAEKIRRIFLGINSVKKVELIGVQPEKIYIEMESSKLAQLGIDPNYIAGMIQAQNAMTPSGMIETKTDNVYLRVSGMFDDLESIRNLPIRATSGTFRLGDIAKVERSFSDPPEPKMFFNGKPVIGLALSMEKGGNILALDKNLKQTLVQIKKELPLGMELKQVADQPTVVKESINEFMISLAVSVAIVLLVCFLGLGVRTGTIVALGIPLVIFGVFVGMKMFAIDLHKVSLGGFIIALGMLVDDTIVTIEMMSVKLEQGVASNEAACFAYNSTAFPRLTGALITCAGFIPVAFSYGKGAEYVHTLFWIVTLSLLISWLVAGTVIPLLGTKLIKIKAKSEQADSHYDPYDTKFYHSFRNMLAWCMNHRILILGLTGIVFIGSLSLGPFIKQEFFPPSTRPELIVDLKLAEGSSLQATETVARQFAKCLKGDPDIKHFIYYVGQGSPRFLLAFDPELPSSDFAEFVIVSKGLKARARLAEKANRIFTEKFPDVRGHVKVMQLGPPDRYPVMLRVTGYDKDKVRRIATQALHIVAANPNLRNVNLDWNEKNKLMHLEIDQDKARMLGINSQQLALILQSQVSGVPVTEFRQKDKTVSVVFRLDEHNRGDLSKIKDLSIPVAGGKFVPLDQIAKISYDAEEGLIWRRSLKPTITIQAETIPGVSGTDTTKQAYAALQKLRNSLPFGYSIDIAGELENMNEALGYLMQPVPMMVVIIVMLLIFQLQNISKMILTLVTAPLGLIGVLASLYLTGSAMGFVADVGILALTGIVIRNSIIMIDQIDQQLDAGESTWDAIINATVMRLRPIILTAATTILGMVPMLTSVFWVSMAVTISGGLLVATILTLVVLPTMYAAWYRVKPNESV